MTQPAAPGSSRPLLCVVAPCFEEEAVVGDFHLALTGVLAALPELRHAIVFVDDGSTDRTLERLNAIAAADPTVRVYSFARNFGHQAAVTCGLDHAGEPDAVIVMDSDLQHPPALIPRLVEEWRKGAHVVQAVREDTVGVGALKRASSRLFYRTFNALSETKLTPGAADFFLLSRSALGALRQMPEYHRFLRGMIAWLGFPRALVPYRAAARTKGASKYTAARMVGLAKDAVFAFSSKPLRVVSRLGLLLVVIGGAFLVEVLWEKFSGKRLEPGWATVVAVVLILGGAQLFTLGLIGEYLSRVFDEVKRRPVYVLKDWPAEPGDAPR
jgi:glycosyltransferase involved in cell wall biosynthesis